MSNHFICFFDSQKNILSNSNLNKIHLFTLSKASNLGKEGWLPEIQTLTVNIPFNRESLGNYSCIAVDPTTEEILHQDTVGMKM